MTNQEIIFWNRVELMEQGVLQGTGETVTIEDPEGNEIELEMPEEIHTFQYWKANGYRVNKGEHAVAKFQIWKMAKKKKGEAEKVEVDEDGNPKKGYMFKKMSHFFKADQVTKIS